MSDERFHTVLGRLDSGPRPGGDEIGQRLWKRIEPVLLADTQPEPLDDRLDELDREVVMLDKNTFISPDTIQPRRSRWLAPAVIAAAAVLVLALAGVVAFRSDGDELATTTPPPLLGCLGDDDSEWQRSEQLGEEFVDYPRLAANDETVVIVGTPRSGTGNAAFSSSDGAQWEYASLDIDPWAVAGGLRGFVVVGADELAFSPDGLSWELESDGEPDLEGGFPGVFAGDVVAGSTGFVVVEGGDELSMWYSPDGRTWTETDLPQLSRGVAAAVAATDLGWAAVTADLSGSQSSVQVWASADGAHWSEVATRGAPPNHVLLDSAFLRPTPLIIHDGTWLLPDPGATDELPEPDHPTVWVSTDEGSTWNERTVWRDIEATGSIRHAAVSEFGFVLVGTLGFNVDDPLRDEYPNSLHWSEDGTSWETCWTTAHHVTDIIGFGDGLVAVAEEPVDVYVWNGR